MITKTVTIQIGNSDNKLSQSQWSHFCMATDNLIRTSAHCVHFYGHSAGDAPWQNACWVIERSIDATPDMLASDLANLAKAYNQDSIAVTSGITQFVSASK